MTVMLIELGLTGVVMFQFGAYYQWSFFFSFATRMFYNSVFFSRLSQSVMLLTLPDNGTYCLFDFLRHGLFSVLVTNFFPIP